MRKTAPAGRPGVFRRFAWALALAASTAIAAPAASIPTLNGGIGDDEAQTMRDEARNYNLQLLFAEQGSGAYLADITLTLVDGRGQTVVAAESAGPWFFARVPPGRYELRAESGGKRQTRALTVGKSGATKAVLYWPQRPGDER